MNRRQVATQFKQYTQADGKPSMEKVCKSQALDFQLQVQQRFLRDWMMKNEDFKYLMLYHEIGSGKTCTAITMAETYLKQNPKGSILVILPARLRSNFYDELMTPCSALGFVSEAERGLLADPELSLKDKRAIRDRIKERIDQKFEVWSFERFKKEALMQGDVRKWAAEFTKNKFVIIDEVHNMISYNYKREHFAHLLKTGKLVDKEVPKGLYPMLLKTFAWNAHKTCKFILLSATPVYNSIVQFTELASLLNDQQVQATSLQDLIEYFRGRVSYFPGTSKSAYPLVEYKREILKPSKKHSQLIEMISDDDSDSFLTKARQIGILYMPGPEPLDVTKESAQQIMTAKKLSEHSPKIATFVKMLKDHPGKHLCYCSYVKVGIDFISQVLEQMLGYVNFADVVSGKKPHQDYKVYACWDGRTNDSLKQMIKARANSMDNLDGKFIKVILGSPAMKEGVSIKHVQHMHLLDPVWNQSGLSQIEGRAVRFCSHIDVPANHPVLKRQVVVHLYQLEAEAAVTSDVELYNHIIPDKYKLVREAELALKKVAIDYHLFKSLYTSKTSPIYKGPGSSPITVERDIPIAKKTTSRFKKVSTTCPKPRRPPCAPGMTEQENKYGDICCYKTKASRSKSKCPTKRRPVNGKCADNGVVRPNKYGDDCCYKAGKAS